MLPKIKHEIFMTRSTLAFWIFLWIVMGSCSKKTADTPLPTVLERLEISPASAALLKSATFQFSLRYFNDVGKEVTPPADMVWTSKNESIAIVNQQGLVTGIAPGQVEISATYKNATATSLITVVSDDTQLSNLVISPAAVQELRRNETLSLSAVGKTITGTVIPGLEINWSSSAPDIASVGSSGIVEAKSYGTTSITASSSGFLSAPLMVQVIRTGAFSGKGSGGTAKLKIENNILKLETSSDFGASTSPPDLRMYLSNNSTNVDGGLELASLNQRSGAQKWNIPTGVQISQYRYVVIWCKQFAVYYGSADLGN